MKVFLLMVFFVNIQVFAKESELIEAEMAMPKGGDREYEPLVSRRYWRGKNLIYDCTARHFVCVNAINYKNCKNERKLAFDKRLTLIPCAPLRTFKTQKECFSYQYKQVHNQKNKLFCTNHKIVGG